MNCGLSTTATQYILAKHVKFIHEQVKYDCPNCVYKAPDTPYLRKFIKSAHEQVKYGCSKCEHKASSQSSLAKQVKSFHDLV